MKRTLFFIVMSFCFVFNLIFGQSLTNPEIEKKIDQLLNQMTLEEKVGQMTQITIQVVAKQKGTATQKFKLDQKKLEEAILKYHVGSILNVWDVALTYDEWHEVITRIQDLATKKTRLKIPVIYGIDAIHGANYIREGTLFPQGIAMAAARNPEFLKKSAEITALEIRAAGIPWNFNPVLGVGRQPLWPRLFETFGEDPYLVTVMGEAYIKGIEGPESEKFIDEYHAAACMKHYLGYSFPFSGKDRTPAIISQNMIRDIFLPPFKKAVEAGVHTVMINSSEVNGIPLHSSHYFITKVLKEELGFQGFVVSDWKDIINLYERDHVASSRKEAAKMAVMAGVDMSMVPYNFSFYEDVLELVKEGEIPMSRIDDAVRRILRVKYKLGLFENPYPSKKAMEQIDRKKFADISYKAAQQAITLLKNKNNTLPLSKNSKVLVTGQNADLMMVMNGGWTYKWQGDLEEFFPPEKMTLKEAVQAKLGAQNVVYAKPEEIKEDKLKALTEDVDAIIVALGEMPYCETPGNINDLYLPKEQYDLVKTLKKTGKPIILVLYEGRPRLITPILDDCEAILLGYLPGPEGGRATADVIFGDYNPCGKLPYTYPKYPNDLLTYDYKFIDSNEIDEEGNLIEKQNLLYFFGHGLSYTTYEYSPIKLSLSEMTPKDELKVSVKVKNTGKMAGRHVVELYLTDMYRTVSPPVRQLKRFKAVYLEPGEEEEVHFVLNVRDMAFWGRSNKWIVEPGEFKITIGDQIAKFRLISDQKEIQVPYGLY